MDLHKIVRTAINTVNPDRLASLKVSIGYDQNPDGDGEQVPVYASEVQIRAQVQALQFTDLQQLDGLNLQDERYAIYVAGNLHGVLRPDSKGGDLITFLDNNEIYLTAMVLERWPDWCKIAATRQMGVGA